MIRLCGNQSGLSTYSNREVGESLTCKFSWGVPSRCIEFSKIVRYRNAKVQRRRRRLNSIIFLSKSINCNETEYISFSTGFKYVRLKSHFQQASNTYTFKSRNRNFSTITLLIYYQLSYRDYSLSRLLSHLTYLHVILLSNFILFFFSSMSLY